MCAQPTNVDKQTPQPFTDALEAEALEALNRELAARNAELAADRDLTRGRLLAAQERLRAVFLLVWAETPPDAKRLRLALPRALLHELALAP